MSILNKAIENGDLETVKNLIEVQGYTANYAGFFGLINIYPLPIKVAAQHNQPEILEYLIEKGANVNGNGDKFNSPIAIANEKGYTKIVAVLLKHDVNLPEWLDKPYLIKKCMNKAIESDDVSAFETLFTYSKAHADSTEFNYSTFSKMTLLDKACQNDAIQIATKLIELGANINLLNTSHSAVPLHYAVFKGNPDMVELLLKNGAIIDFTGPENRTALMAASIYKSEKYEQVLELLIKHGAEINKTDDYGFTALEYAARSGNADAIKILVNAGADLNHQHKAADLALKYGHPEIADMLTSITSDKIVEQTENIDAINIHEVLITNNGSFTSDVINNDNHQLFSTNHSQLVLEQVNTYVPQNLILNQSFEESQIL